ncbi:MAG TPA: adenylate kinase [Anaerolineales bacterium]|nr:adenylate kinase [Anaerolineales bacterium]
MPTYIVLLGPPGVGKGTQAGILSKKLNLPHISSGDLFRENIKNNTELGLIAQDYMNKGELVPDDVTIKMIRARFKQPDCAQGAILDGFPRTPPQAESLSGLLKEFGGQVDLVPFFNAPTEILVDRLAGRWTCKAHGHIFHNIYNPPKITGICDYDQSPLYQRDDDKPETVKKRIIVYTEQTAPLIEYYRQNGVLVEVDGTETIDQVAEQISLMLEKK